MTLVTVVESRNAKFTLHDFHIVKIAVLFTLRDLSWELCVNHNYMTDR